jgi:hypothetical protein
VALDGELRAIAGIAGSFAAPGEELAGVLAAEPREGERIYLCAYLAPEERRTWLALDFAGRPIDDRVTIRDAVSIAALCELAEETAAGGDLDELLSRLVALRMTENPPGIDEAEEAVVALRQVVGAPPRVASPARLDAVGSATRRVERALGAGGASPFAEAMKAAMPSVDSLTDDVERGYKRPLAA